MSNLQMAIGNGHPERPARMNLSGWRTDRGNMQMAMDFLILQPIPIQGIDPFYIQRWQQQRFNKPVHFYTPAHFIKR